MCSMIVFLTEWLPCASSAKSYLAWSYCTENLVNADQTPVSEKDPQFLNPG